MLTLAETILKELYIYHTTAIQSGPSVTTSSRLSPQDAIFSLLIYKHGSKGIDQPLHLTFFVFGKTTLREREESNKNSDES